MWFRIRLSEASSLTVGLSSVSDLTRNLAATLMLGEEGMKF